MKGLNDFWGNAFAANHWSWSFRQQWNGFFPPGYPTILAMLPGSRLVESAYYFNIASGAAMLGVVWWFVRARASTAAEFGVVVAVALHPLVLTQVLTIGPDASFVVLAAAGALLTFAVARDPSPSWGAPMVAGALLGGACWVRYHGLTWAPAVLASAALIGGRAAWRPLAAATLAFATCAGMLALLGIAAGDLSALTRDQAFNVYSRLVHPVNWFHLDREPIPTTLASAIARDPAAFWTNYVAFSTPHLWMGVSCLLAAIVGRGDGRRFAWFALCTGLCFVPIVNLGASPRGVASLVPLVLVSVVWAASDAVLRLGRPVRTVAASALAVTAAVYVGIFWVPENRNYVETARWRAALAGDMEQILRRDRVVLGTQVFAVADFYFVHAPGWHVGNYHPRIKGGWPTLDLPGFLETYPSPATDSLDHFLDDCQRFGITHLVLSDASGSMLRELGQLFDGRLSTERVVGIGEVPGMRALRIVR